MLQTSDEMQGTTNTHSFLKFNNENTGRKETDVRFITVEFCPNCRGYHTRKRERERERERERDREREREREREPGEALLKMKKLFHIFLCFPVIGESLSTKDTCVAAKPH